MQKLSILALFTFILLGTIIGYLLSKLQTWIPRKLLRYWQVQAWEYLYPDKPFCLGQLFSQSFFIKPQSNDFSSIIFCSILLSLLTYLHIGVHYKTLVILLLIWGLLLLAYLDHTYYLLPDCITLPLLWLGLLCNSFNWIVPLQQAVWGTILGYLSLWLIATLFIAIRKTEGLGQGDFKLLALLGAWLGTAPLLYIILLASLTGISIGIMQLLTKQRILDELFPFGPHLIFSGLIYLFEKI